MSRRQKALWAFVGITSIASVTYYLSGILKITQRYSMQSSCLSSLISVSRASLQYASDFDDKLPPVFVFSESPNEETKRFDILISGYEHGEAPSCPIDSVSHPNQEFGFVHCRSLMAWIPNYSSGNRVLQLGIKGFDDSQIFYMRDPVRGSETKLIDGNQRSVLTSPHGEDFNVSYLDGHASHKKRMDIFSIL